MNVKGFCPPIIREIQFGALLGAGMMYTPSTHWIVMLHLCCDTASSLPDGSGSSATVYPSAGALGHLHIPARSELEMSQADCSCGLPDIVRKDSVIQKPYGSQLETPILRL